MELGTYLAVIGFLWWTVIWCICLLGWRVAKTKYVKDHKSIHDSEGTSPYDENPTGVSILRPLSGLDTNLYENLESTFVQRYPADKSEVICSVADENDEAIPIVNILMEKYPEVNARLIVGEEIVGINPKINNLVRSYRAAKYDMLWVVDSNIQMSHDALARAIACFSPVPMPSKPIGLVHHVPFPVFPDINLGSRVEQAFLGTTHAKMYLALNETAIDSCVNGKSCLFRKSDLERCTGLHQDKYKEKSSVNSAINHLPEQDRNGIAAFGEFLGEDNTIGRFIWHDGGMRHAIAPDIAANAVGTMPFEKYFWRRVRWIRVRKYMVVASTLVEPLTESILCGLIGSIAFKRFFHVPRFLFLLLHLAAWYAVDISIFRVLMLASPAYTLHNPGHDGPGQTGFRLSFLTAWCTREISALPIWLFAMLGNKVSWREDGKVYRLRRDGKVETGGGTDCLDKMAQTVLRRLKGGDMKRLEELTVDHEERS